MKKYTLDDFINEECATDPEFKQIWDEDEPEREFAISMIHARKSKNMTQKQLSKMTGISQGKLSKIENGEANPTLKVMSKIANALDMNISLVPKQVQMLQVR